MRWALAAVLLAGCTNWTDLECDVRKACGDAGDALPLPIDVVAAFSDTPDTPVIGLARGSRSWFLASRHGLCLGDGGCPYGGDVAAVDAAGNPSRFWFATTDLGVERIEELDAGVMMFPAALPAQPATLGAYKELDGSIAAAVIASDPLRVEGFDDADRGGDQLPCKLAPEIDSAAIDGLTAVAVVGQTGECLAIADAGMFAGFAVAFFPRGAANTVAPLVAEPNAGRARIGSNGSVGVAVMETGDGIAAVRVHDLDIEGSPSLALHILDAGPNPRGFLDDVEQGADGSRFVVSLSNPGASPVRISNADSTTSFSLAPGSTGLIVLQWVAGVPTIIRTWTLAAGAPADIHLDADPDNTDVWLAASCRADAGPSVPCASGSAGKFVLRLPPLPF